MPGTLFVVATPIGNLEDLTFRALRTLREVHLIAAEDTRRTSKLLAHYDIHKPLVSLHEHNESREASGLVARLTAGEDIALVSDAGTPGISDPGQLLVAAARAADINVVPIPGPSAVTAALSASGLPGGTFVFMGFPPSSGKDRQEWLEALKEEPGKVVFFEAPHRIERTMRDVVAVSGTRQTIVAREISKIYESFVIWTKSCVADGGANPKGEFVVIVGQIDEPPDEVTDGNEASRLVGLITEHVTSDYDAAVRAAAAILERPARRVRTAVKKARILQRRASES